MRALIVGTILVFCFLATGCKGIAYKVSTASMSPALKVGDAFIVNSTIDPVNRFDMVVYKSQPVSVKIEGIDENTRFVHRVIGLSGEKIEIRKGKVFVDGIELDEPFETFKSDDDFGPVFIPEDEFFLMGDNRSQSLDSRYWKNPTIKRADISGKVGQIYPGYYKK